MISFDRHGNPQPLGFIFQPLEALKTVFVDGVDGSTTRTEIFSHYQRYIGDFSNEVTSTFRHWINGSFTTTKVNPNDIDLVNVVDYSDELNDKEEALKKYLTQFGTCKDEYMVDGYFLPVYDETDERFMITQEWAQYWATWFGQDRNGNPKGIIEVAFSN